MAKNEPIRLQKLLSQCGIASRRKAEQMIIDGHVKVNGKTAQLGDKVRPTDKVFVNGKRVLTNAKPSYRYIMLNKPRGYVTTVSDELGRKTVMDLVDCEARVYPVGRLDKDSEGLLILTNDGSFANALTHPKHNYAKVYRVTVKPSVNDEMLEKMRNGIEIDGRKTAPCDINVITEEDGRVVLEFILREGRNRQIRKMCEAVGLQVARLKRISIGPVKLGMLQTGKTRRLTDNEVHKLLRSSNPATQEDNN